MLILLDMILNRNKYEDTNYDFSGPSDLKTAAVYRRPEDILKREELLYYNRPQYYQKQLQK